jgi:hypothetical protein
MSVVPVFNRQGKQTGTLMARRGKKAKPKPVSMPVIPTIEVDNPLFQRSHMESRTNPARIRAAYNPRESYVGFLFGKKLITEAEKRAGDKVRQAFEAMGGSGARAIDYGREHVDGGRIAESLTEYQLEAGKTLRDVHRILGALGHDLVLRLAGEGKWPRDIAPMDTHKQKYLSMRFRECLETLAIHWGYQRALIVHARVR